LQIVCFLLPEILDGGRLYLPKKKADARLFFIFPAACPLLPNDGLSSMRLRRIRVWNTLWLFVLTLHAKLFCVLPAERQGYFLFRLVVFKERGMEKGEGRRRCLRVL
jgi:hypothetical protein